MISTAMLAAAITCGASAARAAGASIAGDCAVFSPDGGRIAFQRERGDAFDLVVRDLSTGEETLVEKGGKVIAGQPAWGPDGSLAYVMMPATNTAYEAAVAKSEDGSNLWLWKDGARRRITWGRVHDSTPSFGPDGRIYFASACGYAQRKAGTPALFVVDPREARPERKMIYFAPNARTICVSTGVSQPSVSPDGKLLVWTEINALDDVWHICIARLSDPAGTMRRLTPFAMWAYSPRWCPDGRHVVFTGFNAGDDGWGVHVADARTGAIKRLFPGEEPSLSADGRRIVFTRDASLRFADVTPDTFTFRAGDSRSQPWDEPERLLLAKTNMTNSMSAALGDDFKFGSDRTFFVRAEFDYDGDISKNHDIVHGIYKESHIGFHLYLIKGTPNFGTRYPDNRHLHICSNGKFKDRHGMLTGIRTKDAIYLYVEGGGFYSKGLGKGAIALDHPIRVEVGNALSGSVSLVRKLDIGTGWPVNVPKPFAGEELFK